MKTNINYFNICYLILLGLLSNTAFGINPAVADTTTAQNQEPSKNKAESNSPATEKSATVPPAAKRSPGSIGMGPMFDGRFINAELEGGFIAWNKIRLPSRFFSRIRIGLLRAKDPIFATMDLGIDIGGLRTGAVGIHFCSTHLVSGLFAQAGWALAFDKTSIFSGSVGWSIFGVEAQIAPFEDADRLILFKLRVPFGIGLYGTYKMQRDVLKQTGGYQR